MKQFISLLWVFLFLQLTSQAQSVNTSKINESKSPHGYEINCYQLKASLQIPQIVKQRVTVKAYPNPVTDFLTIESSLQGYVLTRILVFDINSGKKVKERTAHNEVEIIDLSDLPLGIYSVVVYQHEKTTTIKIMKN